MCPGRVATLAPERRRRRPRGAPPLVRPGEERASRHDAMGSHRFSHGIHRHNHWQVPHVNHRSVRPRGDQTPPHRNRCYTTPNQ